MFSARWFLLLLLFGIFVRTSGWGREGHSLIVRLAESQFTNSTSKWIESLLPSNSNGNSSAMATWADDILYENSNRTRSSNWQWSRPLHYINTPDWICNYTSERDCVNDSCVAGAIQNYTKRLENETDIIQQAEALYFLFHFVGDIHQPLHVGFKDDRGGNNITGHYMGHKAKLHQVWDEDLLETRLKRDFNSNISLYYNYIYELMTNDTSFDNATDNDIEQWINEDIDIVCSHIYIDENNSTMNTSHSFTLGEIYYNRSISIVERRLAQGGRRLGALLNSLKVKPPQEVSTATKQELCWLTILLISISYLRNIY